MDPLRSMRWQHKGRSAGSQGASITSKRAVGEGLLRALGGATSSGRIPVLVRLKGVKNADALGLMPVAGGLAVARLTVAEMQSLQKAHPQLEFHAGPPRRLFLNRSHKWHRSKMFKEQTGLDGKGVVVGIVDTGIDVGHADFRSADGKSRVAWLLAAGVPQGLHPELEKRYGCSDAKQTPCGIYSNADIDRLLADAPWDAPRDAVGHGTHVASIAAGHNAPSGKFDGMAPGATLIVAAPASEGFSDPDILNAVRFIFERADALGLPCVVNLSLGSDYGAHDGSSELEQGLAAMVGDDKPGRALVVAAGNSGALYNMGGRGPFGVHTEVASPSHGVARVPILAPGATGKASGAGFVWINFEPGDRVAVGLEGPDGNWIGLTEPGDEVGYEDDGIRAGVIHSKAVVQTAGGMASRSAVVVWEGSWPADGEFAIRLRGKGLAKLWVSATGSIASNGLGLMFERAVRAGTIAVPASHPELIAVGCTLNRLSWFPHQQGGLLRIASFGGESDPLADSSCYFSAAGPNASGWTKPDLLAPGALVAAAMSQDADPRKQLGSIFDLGGCPDERPCHLLDDTHALNTGTSMAAPQVAGAVALMLQREPNLTQGRVLQLLQAGARRPIGRVPYDYQQGPGALDLIGTLQAMDEQYDATRAASLDESYWVLSAPYLRPNPEAPVYGTLELRHADKSIATALVGSELVLRVAGASVHQKLERVRAGLFRFAVAAPRGSGGKRARIELRYRGQSLGTRTLPIAIDAWAATSGWQAVGGCALGSGGGPAAPPGSHRGLAAMCAALAAVWLRRRVGKLSAKVALLP